MLICQISTSSSQTIMAIAETLEKIRKLLDQENIEEAQKQIDGVFATEKFPSFNCFLLQSEILLRNKNYDGCRIFANKAFTIAFANGKRDWISETLKIISMSYFREKDYENSFKYIVNSCKYDDIPASEGHMFKGIVSLKYKKKHFIDDEALAKLERDYLANSIKPANDVVPPKTAEKPENVQNLAIPTVTPTTTPKALTKQKLRFDWFDSLKAVEISVYIKKIKSDTVVSKHTSDSLHFQFQDSAEFTYEFSIERLYSTISKVDFKVKGTKLEIFLTKEKNITWSKLERDESIDEQGEVANPVPVETKVDPVSYPSSSKKRVDWSKFTLEEEDDDTNEGADFFFKKLYEGADDNAKRAMMKSFMESNGTTLSTDWNDVGSREVKPEK